MQLCVRLSHTMSRPNPRRAAGMAERLEVQQRCSKGREKERFSHQRRHGGKNDKDVQGKSFLQPT